MVCDIGGAVDKVQPNIHRLYQNRKNIISDSRRSRQESTACNAIPLASDVRSMSIGAYDYLPEKRQQNRGRDKSTPAMGNNGILTTRRPANFRWKSIYCNYYAYVHMLICMFKCLCACCCFAFFSFSFFFVCAYSDRYPFSFHKA